ncbi:class I SAM-dependent methyltransferase [Paenibacillus sp. DMB20]|uniref:class I SAM-dependent methyltransferase n=1 Tax=Paenibacillus sp. DMB20 TaxID=1642570 RepID=UPI000B205EBA|nr:class I SAM-dependent methyltransferase [Paenibacillus sp. DMB20]
MKIVSTKEHYDLLIEEGNDPYYDPPLLQEYMSNWDGPHFYKALDVKDKVVLEIGVGTGRLAKKMLLSGCKKFDGIDISLKTLNRAKENLVDFSNAEFELVDIIDYVRPDFYDCAYSVLTFFTYRR